jgi:ABC-type methionine transport system ATPase subunit
MSMLSKRKVRLTYPSKLLDQPVLYRLIVEFGVMVNVLEANVNSREGWFVVELEGPAAAVLQGLDWMSAQGIEVEFLRMT